MTNNNMPVTDVVRAQLVPTGVLRASINLGNIVLVTGRGADGMPVGVAPDMARALAECLGVSVQLVPFETPGALGDAVNEQVWDVGLIGAEPQRAESIAFTSPYCEIEATYLVAAGSSIAAIDEVDRPGVRISVYGRAAYGLWLERNIQHATVAATESTPTAVAQFEAGGADVLAGLRAALVEDAQRLPGTRLLDGHFATVQQAIGVPIAHSEASQFLQQFVEDAKSSGLVASLIAKHGVDGKLSVAP